MVCNLNLKIKQQQPYYIIKIKLFWTNENEKANNNVKEMYVLVIGFFFCFFYFADLIKLSVFIVCSIIRWFGL